MSGSAGLASARRRRAGQANPPNSPNKEINDKPTNIPNNAQVDPLALLLKHNELIKKVFQEVAVLKSNEKPVETDKESIEYFK